MSRTYYHTPPTVPQDVPVFIFRNYSVSNHVKEMIQWAAKEYRLAYQHLSRHARPSTLQFFLEEYSPMRVLAESEGFRDLLKMLDERNYNQLSLRERVFLRRAYELFKHLS